ncbi:FAD-dependent oxidoreductase [Aromatoleum sp.]|uniref:FAD-dependent oxidoreductase n=1 Tax=Aromatoleum sp. TaxID=2307007 RepID=UPI002FC895BF
MGAPLVIVGTGTAGYALLRAVRRVDPRLPVLLLTADDGLVYDKFGFASALAHRKDAAELVFATAEQMAHRYGTTVLTQRQVLSVDRASRQVVTAGGAQPYLRLVIATGAVPRLAPALRGTAAGKVLRVGGIADYAYLRHRLVGRNRVLVLGGTISGCEFADGLARAGFDVDLLEPANQLFADAWPGLFAGRIEQALREAGVRPMIEDGLQRLEQGPDALVATTLAGLHLSPEVVIAALGSHPRTRLATDCGLAVASGIVVDARFRTADPHIHAFGECAEFERRTFKLAEDIDAGAAVLAAILAGNLGQMRWQPRVRHLQIERCAAVVCEPPPVAGEWHERRTARGVRSVFHDDKGRLRGFALAGEAAPEADRLLKHVVR